MKVKSESEVAQSCLTLCDSMDCHLPGSSVHGIFQARVLEWVPLPSPNYKLQVFKGYHFKNRCVWKVTKMNLDKNGVKVTELKLDIDLT